MATDKKIALITGANKGIGLETAKQLSKSGIVVLMGSRNLDKGHEAVAEVKRYNLHADAQAVKLDMDTPGDHAAVAEFIKKEFGVLDILINNAGVLLDGRKGNETSRTSQEMLRKTFDTNFFSVVALTQTMLPLLRKSIGGRIVNLSSITGSLTLQADPGSPVYDVKTFAYNASKAALNAFTIHLAHELKDTKIKVNSAHPGWVKTEMGGDGAQLEVETGAKTTVELATLQDSGPTGGYLHLGKPLPW